MRFFRQIWLALLLGSFILPTTTLCAQEMGAKKKVKTSIKAWNMSNDYGIADTVSIDTLPVNFPMRDVLQDRSIAWAYNGNLISPTQSKIYFDRTSKLDFLFGSAYEPYVITPQDVRFYHTTIAYSDIAYKKSFTKYRNENDLHFSFTGNVNKQTNLSILLNYLTSPGQYLNQEGKVLNGYVAGSYDGQNYGLHAALTFSKLSNFENGGLSDTTLLGGVLGAADLPVKMQGMSGFGYISGFLDHHYSITKLRDTIEVPMLTFNHVFEVNNSTKRYIEKTADQHYLPEPIINPLTTHDSAAILNIRNTLAVTFNEEFNRLLRFGATAYATNECQRAQFLEGETDTVVGSKWMNNTWVGGAIYKRDGSWIRYEAQGDVCLLGYKLGEFQVNGHLDGIFPIKKDTLLVRANAYVKNETPSWFMQHYRSNHYIWENDFGKTYRFYVGGEVNYPNQWVKARAKVGFENITRHIYFSRDGLPTQHDGNVQVLSVDARVDLTTPWINLENNVIYQMSSSTTLPLPALTLYHNLYYHGWWFKAMYAQLGVDMRYHTAYYAPQLNPAIGQFCMQEDVKIGNYPVMNLYANFYVKLLKLRFFAQWQHFNYLFMKDTQRYMHMPDYAMNPSVFRAGAAWHFWR